MYQKFRKSTVPNNTGLPGFTYNTVVHIQFSGSQTIQWFTYNTVVHMQYSGSHTIQ